MNNINGLKVPTKITNINPSNIRPDFTKIQDIGNLLNGGKAQSAPPPKEIEQKDYEYKGNEGTLISYEDGSYTFKCTRGNSQLELHFKDEKSLKKQMPHKQVVNPNDPQKRKTINYRYYRNGKLSSSETLNSKNIRINKCKYNRQGERQEEIEYDNNGQVKFISKYKYNTDNSVVISKYDKNNELVETTTEQRVGGKKVSSQTRYANGQLKAETVYWDNGVIKEQTQYDENGNVTKRISAEIDGDFGESRQAKEGDCYLLATINGIRNLTNGQEMLKKLVDISTDENGQKVYTVTLPGAQIAAEGLKQDARIDPKKMHIKGTYTFTESEMQEILKQAGNRYSIGDGDVILLEAAFEKYRKEVDDTVKANRLPKSSYAEAGLQTGSNTNNILAGGKAEDATFILTGIQSELFSDNKCQYGVSYEALLEGRIEVVQQQREKAISEVDNLTNSREDLAKMLDEIMNDPKDGETNLIASVAFATVHENGSGSGHQITIKSVTKDTVTLINPWHPDRELTMSREDFLQSAKQVCVTNANKKAVTVEDVQNGTVLLTPRTQRRPNRPQAPATQEVQPAAQQGVSQATEQQSTTYKVKRGDNLWKIAKRTLGATASNREIANFVEKIIAANPNLKSNPNLILIGQNIIMP